MNTCFCPRTRHPNSNTSGLPTQPLGKRVSSLIQCTVDVPLSTPVESDPPPPISTSWARRGAVTTSHARE